MDFALTEEQRMLEASLRGFLADRLPMERRRAVAASGTGHDAALWAGLVAQGVAGLAVPERYGGAGLGVLDAAVAAEALAYHAAPVPFAASLVMAPIAIAAAGSEPQRQAWLPRIAAGEVRLAVGFAAPIGQTGEGQASLDRGRLTGRVQAAMGGGGTHALVYLADGRAALVAVDGEGVRAEMVPGLDRTRPLLDLSLADAPAEVLSAANDAQAARTRVLDAGRVMLAADTLGAAQAMLDQAVAFAKERRQFGRAIGSFQAVKHTLADLAAALEPCRALVWYAAHAQDALPEEARLAALQAKAHLDEVGREVARLATEVHGGMGFTDLAGLHFWFKRIAANRQLLGSPERCRHEAALVQGWIPA